MAHAPSSPGPTYPVKTGKCPDPPPVTMPTFPAIRSFRPGQYPAFGSPAPKKRGVGGAQTFQHFHNVVFSSVENFLHRVSLSTVKLCNAKTSLHDNVRFHGMENESPTYVFENALKLCHGTPNQTLTELLMLIGSHEINPCKTLYSTSYHVKWTDQWPMVLMDLARP